MANDKEEDTNVTPLNNSGGGGGKPPTSASILAQIQGEADKDRSGKVKQQLKELVARRVETEKLLSGINAQINEICRQFDAKEI